MTDRSDSFWADADRAPRLGRRRDPFLGRLLAVGCAVGLLVPVAMALGERGTTPNPTGVGGAAILEPGVDESTSLVDTSSIAPSSISPTSSLSLAATIETPEPVAPETSAAKAAMKVVEQSGPKCGGKFNVKLGDSWSLLGDYAGVPTRDLLAVNKATSRTVIVPGDELCVPLGSRFRRPAPAVATTQPKKATSTQKPLVVVAAKRFSAAQSTQFIRDAFPDDLETRALDIAQRESRLNAAGYNWCCYGLFQIHFQAHKSWLASLGVSNPSQLLDAGVNARAALTLYKRSNSWAAWE